MTVSAAPAARKSGGMVRRPPSTIVFLVLLILLVVATLAAAAIGPASIPLQRLAAIVGLAPSDPATLARDQLILWSIRLPRIAIAAMVGGLLAASGTVMQGLFRNPLADPALVGVSGGAALAAAITIVISDKFLQAHVFAIPFEVLPALALCGALIATATLYKLATRDGRTSIAIFLLGGLAIAALANAAIGLLVFLADDRQLRDITFWMLGSLSGATWTKAGAILPFFLATIIALPVISRALDLLVLGEAEAFHAGIHVERLKKFSILLIAAAVGAAVSVSGVIGFVGIVVPHLLRLVIGPGHRMLLPAAVILGATLMVSADILSRTLAAPAELPIGIVTAVVGAPFFLGLLLRQRMSIGL
jgi:iron complex transport system permease protein